MVLVSPPSPAHRELPVTPPRHRVIARLRNLVVAAAISACGGGGRSGDTYTRATDVQGACCEHLSGDARTSCLAQVVRVDDAEVARTPVNQQTYACVVDHFACDAATGKPTQASAQAQLECIQDLEGEPR